MKTSCTLCESTTGQRHFFNANPRLTDPLPSLPPASRGTSRTQNIDGFPAQIADFPAAEIGD